MKYLVVDAELSGTGIRDKYNEPYFYLNPQDLGLSNETISKLNEWLLKYQEEHYKGFKESNVIDQLDEEGRNIALIIKNELIDVKMEYYSDASMRWEII